MVTLAGMRSVEPHQAEQQPRRTDALEASLQRLTREMSQRRAMEQAAALRPVEWRIALLSRELRDVDLARIPDATLRCGILSVPMDSFEAANAELRRIGCPVRVTS